MAALAAAPEPQTTIDETTIDNADLEAALDRREDAKTAKAEASSAYKAADDIVKAQLEQLDITDGQRVRVAGYLIERRPVASRDVAFTTDPTSRLWITRDA